MAATVAHITSEHGFDMDLETPGLSNSVATPDQIAEILSDLMDLKTGDATTLVNSAAGARSLV